MPKTPEGYVLDAVMGWLAAKRVLAFRMAVGAMKVDQRFMRWGTPGMADVLAFPSGRVLWIEAKSVTGKQSEMQKSFQRQVEEYGHLYVVCRSIDDLAALPIFRPQIPAKHIRNSPQQPQGAGDEDQG